jgi:hypothetical protein
MGFVVVGRGFLGLFLFTVVGYSYRYVAGYDISSLSLDIKIERGLKEDEYQ